MLTPKQSSSDSGQQLITILETSEREREDSSITPFKPHRVDAGQARASPGRSHEHTTRAATNVGHIRYTRFSTTSSTTRTDYPPWKHAEEGMNVVHGTDQRGYDTFPAWVETKASGFCFFSHL